MTHCAWVMFFFQCTSILRTCAMTSSSDSHRTHRQLPDLGVLRFFTYRFYSHTTFLCTILQYCNKKIKRYCDKKKYFSTNIFFHRLNWKYLFLSMDTRVCIENHNILNAITIFWRKNDLFIAISFYLNIFLSQYCVLKYCVWRGP